MVKKLVGKIVHFYPNISVGVVELSSGLKSGDKIAIEGKNNFEQTVTSMQIEHKAIKEAKAKQTIGLRLDSVAKQGDLVYKL
ncbi:MAG: translation elongation factor-like protein [Nanoarchaeota archaeon]